jgi:hypothetical protein
MKVAGAVLGLTAVDLFGVVEVLPVVGDQGQVDRQALRAPAQRSEQTAGQSAVELALEFGEFGQRGIQCLANGLLGGEVVEPPAGGVDRGDFGGSDQQDGPQSYGGDLALVVAQRDMLLQVPGGGPMNLLAVESTMVWAHGSLRVWLLVQKP